VPVSLASATGAPTEMVGERQPAPPDAHVRGLGPVVRVCSERQARVLYGEIVRRDRDYPVVGLTCRAGKRDPALAVERVRERVWPSVPIYVIEPRESRTLNNLLPKELGAYNGAARVWWPGVDGDSEPSWHPLIYDRKNVYGEGVLERLAAEFTSVPESVAELAPREQAALRLRSVPRSVFVPRGRGSGVLVALATRRDLRRLTGELRRPDRDYPVVVVATGDSPGGPAFHPSEIRSRLDLQVPLYVLGSADLSRRLEQTLGLAVGGGDARVFWPGVGRGCDPAEHPLVPAYCGSDRRDPVDRLILALDQSRPTVRGHVADIQGRLERREQQASDTLAQLRQARGETEDALRRALAAERELVTLGRQLAALREAGLDTAELEAVAGMDGEALMQRLICREWLSSLGSADRREHLLGGYRLGPVFLASVEDRRIATPRARVAFVCAMVACGRASDLAGLEPHPWREGKLSGSGDDPQTVRADGGKGLMCNLGHGRGAARLFYWALPDGTIEFDSVRNHDAIGHRG
jgi:hypothetical protein